MNHDEAAGHLATIRRIMESATQVTVLPGWASVAGGVLALVACGVTFAVTRSLDLGEVGSLSPGQRNALILVWLALGGVAAVVDLIATAREAKRHGRSPWSRMRQLAVYAVGPAVVSAAVISAAFARVGEWGTIPAVWMMLYGAALWTVGVLSVHSPGKLGLVFFAMGLLTCFWLQAISLVTVALSFGLGHIVFGVYRLTTNGNGSHDADSVA